MKKINQTFVKTMDTKKRKAQISIDTAKTKKPKKAPEQLEEQCKKNVKCDHDYVQQPRQMNEHTTYECSKCGAASGCP